MKGKQLILVHRIIWLTIVLIQINVCVSIYKPFSFSWKSSKSTVMGKSRYISRGLKFVRMTVFKLQLTQVYSGRYNGGCYSAVSNDMEYSQTSSRNNVLMRKSNAEDQVNYCYANLGHSKF
ncbi:hypothetical protein FKM82_005594 [Ascaphus truei]